MIDIHKFIVSLVAFWTASRLGELICTEQCSIDFIRVITWSKLNIISDSHYTLFIALPKENMFNLNSFMLLFCN